MVSLVTLLCHLLDNENLVRPGFGENTCFFSTYLAQIIFLHGIIAAILAINLAFFLASAYSLLFGLWSGAGDAASGRLARTRSMLVVVTELFLVMGLTWVAEVVSTVLSWRRGEAYSGPEILVFDVINSLQGLLIFLVLVCKPRMRSKIRATILDLVNSCGWNKQQENTMVRLLNITSLCCLLLMFPRLCTLCHPRPGPRTSPSPVFSCRTEAAELEVRVNT